jgi:hypothetical protein
MKDLWTRTRWPVAFLLAYLIGRLLLPLASPSHGLLTPDGQLHLPSTVATFTVLLLRLSALFVAAPLIVYRVVLHARRWRAT